MRDMNDMWVNDNCQLKLHCRNHVFTVSELFDIAQLYSSQEKWDAHKETADDKLENN
jgi:hypothetical protein